jgi:hypothetical protein
LLRLSGLRVFRIIRVIRVGLLGLLGCKGYKSDQGNQPRAACLPTCPAQIARYLVAVFPGLDAASRVHIQSVFEAASLAPVQESLEIA